MDWLKRDRIIHRQWNIAVNFFMPARALHHERFARLCHAVIQSYLFVVIVGNILALSYFALRVSPVWLEFVLLLGGAYSPVIGALFLRLTAKISASVVITNILGIAFVTAYALLTNCLSSPAIPILFGFLVMGAGFERRVVTAILTALVILSLSLLYTANEFGLRPAYQIPLTNLALLQFLGLIASVTLMAIGLFLGTLSRQAQRQRLTGALTQAQVANKAKTQFLANMSHELRTPLNAIIGFSELLKNQMFGPIGNPRYLEYSDDIQHAGHRLLNVIDDVLDISAIESQDFGAIDEEIDASELVAACVSMLAGRFKSSEITLTTMLAPNLPRLRGAQTRLKQIIVNLLENALKFSPAGGEVRIHAYSGENGGVTFEISDLGMGMVEADIPRLLEPFTQVHEADSRPHDGVGLGLYIANRLVELHDGRLDIVSAPGTGTKVYVHFPEERLVPAPV
ncbi:MAG: HAMP domain-containing histidine kinase [Rhodospirillaceae bacterium]|jgi:signal transduction histidine kinase|nr:HAMP domain-containing histidine kinase [Rhodospirillaceae bacterium]MBT3491833.1 HAMP domain-containing histidine kinase [Rhodospirillaceae bacterium]MBT3783111.1 HAMP domain-containing histidine kinase [Rhodospirillaceae bacterium]MBT3978107.1 HAMP domain-containing histidine kinase [Rhodospirillaceae bacterium]MBT4167745.1 HAMP domain-containing histidine kinase [Rhodospirillaceae bacterium]